MGNNKVVARQHPDDTRELELSSSDIQIPTSTDCKIFEEISPGSFDRFLAVYENESKYRHAFSNKAIDYEYSLGVRGMTYALIFGLGCLGASIYLFAIGMALAGVGIIIAEMVAGMYVLNPRGKEPEKKKIEDKK